MLDVKVINNILSTEVAVRHHTAPQNMQRKLFAKNKIIKRGLGESRHKGSGNSRSGAHNPVSVINAEQSERFLVTTHQEEFIPSTEILLRLSKWGIKV